MGQLQLQWSKLTPLVKENIELIPLDTAGIYRLSSLADDKQVYVFYVGKSINIKKSLLQHISSETNVCIKNYIDIRSCYFRYAVLNGEEERSAGQRQLYRFYQPSCNDRMPDGDESIVINVT